MIMLRTVASRSKIRFGVWSRRRVSRYSGLLAINSLTASLNILSGTALSPPSMASSWFKRALNSSRIILRNRLLPKTVGVNASACYPLLDKAVDPDDPLPSLAWFATGFEVDDLQVMGQGTHELCLRPRANFEGCMLTRFIVRDPKGAEDAHGLRTCWRTIELHLPIAIQTRLTVR